MYNLLIVDDEKIIRDGIFELLSLEDKLELNLFSAASAIEAESILEVRKIDIVLTDIQMPKMTGLELMDDILERWPHCRVIFLTGYSEFDYVYKVHQHARYILKAEDDSKIIEAVAETIEDIENDFLIERIALDSNLLKKRQQEYGVARLFYDLFHGFINISNITSGLFERLEIDLDINSEMYYMVIRHDHIIKDNYDEQMKITDDMQLLLDKYFFDYMHGVSYIYRKNFIVLLLQPVKKISRDRNIIELKGKSELFQKACMKNFSMSVAVAIGGSPLMLGDILDGFHISKARFMISNEDNLLVVDESAAIEPDSGTIAEQRKNIIKSRLQLLDYYFENSNRELVISFITDTRSFFNEVSSMQDLFAVEIYSAISVKLIQYINQFNLSREIYDRINVYGLYNLTSHKNWQEAFSYLIDITEFIFELKTANLIKHNDDVINRVKKYIRDNLSGDTSLDALGDLVGLSPEYLLRLFKKSEDLTILQYINDLKIIKAKNLIADRELQIKEIAIELGFSSSGYFGRFFKSKTGLSPQGYRDQLG